MNIQELASKIAHNRSHPLSKNIHIAHGDLLLMISGLPMMSVDVIRPTNPMLMGYPLIWSGDDFILWMCCESCGTQEYPKINVCSKCGAPL